MYWINFSALFFIFLPCFQVSGTDVPMFQTGFVKRDIYFPPDINQMTPDARNWYLTGIDNAKRNLDAFSAISTKIQNGKDASSDIKRQLETVLTQVTDASTNTQNLAPKLTYLIDSLVQWSRDPGCLDKLKLKVTVCYISGKRDNKSYYLQNGIGYWFRLRLDDYLKKIPTPNPVAEKLIQDFQRLEDKVLLARDTLDDAAQEYVKGIAQLVTLVDDIGKNAVKIREVTDEMKSTMDKSQGSIIKTAKDSVEELKKEIDSL